MRRRQALLIPLSAALLPGRARAEPVRLRLGVLTDMSAEFSDWTGTGSLVAARMAAQDFMAAAPGTEVDVIGADHQNKADIASGIARRWISNGQADAIFDVVNSAAALAVNSVVRDGNKVLVVASSVTDDLTGRACSPNTVQWGIDSWALAHGTGRAVVGAGGDTWFFITSDFAGGRSLETAVTDVVKASGGRVVGNVYPPIGTPDFSSFLVQAQASKAKVVALSMGGGDLTNVIKQAGEFGVTRGSQKLAALVIQITEIHALGLKATQGLQFTTAFYRDLNDGTRAWSGRFAALRGGAYPSQAQASVYAGALHFLKAASRLGGAADGRAVVAAMKATETDDPLFGRGVIRPDGRKVHDLFLVEAKRPDESAAEWDLDKLVLTIPAAEAFRPMDGRCDLPGAKPG